LLPCVVVTKEYFKNVTDAIVDQSVTLPCTASADADVVWSYQEYCEHVEHGLYLCSNPTDIITGQQYHSRVNSAGEHSLLVTAVTKNMTGFYTCKDRDTDHVLYSGLLNVISQYISVLFSHLCLLKFSECCVLS